MASAEGGGARPAAGSAAYVDVKVQLLLGYLVCLVYYLLLKTRGLPVRDHPVVLRLIWIRTLLEKMRPVDQRLQYQMSRLLQALDAPAGAKGGDGDLKSLKPGELAANVEDEEGDEDEAAPVEADDDGIYKPPMIAQVEYTGDHVSMQERAEKDLERAKGRLERSEFVRSLRAEFTEAPHEVHGSYQSSRAEKAARKMTEQQEYEEERMVRLRTSKRDLKAQRRMLRETRAESGGAVSLDDATADFRELSRAGPPKGGGRGRKAGARGGSALQEFQNATERARQARRLVGSARDGGGPGKKGGGGKDGLPQAGLPVRCSGPARSDKMKAALIIFSPGGAAARAFAVVNVSAAIGAPVVGRAECAAQWRAQVRKLRILGALAPWVERYQMEVFNRAQFLTELRGRGLFFVFVGSLAITQCVMCLLFFVGIWNLFMGVVCVMMSYGINPVLPSDPRLAPQPGMSFEPQNQAPLNNQGF
ncbi:unnamed protein product [Prorocentrum cordatum]|uniref:Uncharacterized protein n=1 Tax=Prorocentrum cordatum TaxID=2364126 RepID=A0ABN9W3K0_9DINO|nr:unnamed protein product [Polarella glacialis]